MTPRRHTPADVMAALERTRGDVTRAMRSLGLARETYYSMAADHPEIREAAEALRPQPKPRRHRAVHHKPLRASERERLEVDTLRTLEALDPDPDEYEVWLAALGRWGLAEPSVDDVLTAHYDTPRWDQVRPGLAGLLSGLASA